MDLRFWRWAQQQRAAEDQCKWDEWSAWTDGMIARGWHHWLYSPPPASLTFIEMSRREWPMIHIGAASDLFPETNINGLWWRKCGDITIEAGGIVELEEVKIGSCYQHQIAR